MTTQIENQSLYETEIQVFVKSPFIKKIITLFVKNGSTWGELVEEYVKHFKLNDVQYSLDNFCEDFYGEFRVTSFNRRFKYNDFKDSKLIDIGLEKDKEIMFKKIPKEIPDTIGEKVLYAVFTILLNEYDPRKQQIIVSNNSFNVTDSVEKNIRQQWQLRHINKSKEEIIIVLWDKAFFNSLSENYNQVYDYIKLKETTFPNDKIRIFKKDKNDPVEMTKGLSERKIKYFETLKYLISENNFTDKKITWYVINFNDTSLLPFDSIIKKVFSDKKIPTDLVTFSYFSGDRYYID